VFWLVVSKCSQPIYTVSARFVNGVTGLEENGNVRIVFGSIIVCKFKNKNMFLLYLRNALACISRRTESTKVRVLVMLCRALVMDFQLRTRGVCELDNIRKQGSAMPYE